MCIDEETMIIGVGTDITQKSDIFEDYLHPDDAFVRTVFTKKEREEARKRADYKSFLISRFSAKEAVFKALDTFPEGFDPMDIEILNTDAGLPYVNLYGEAKKRAKSAGIQRVLISLSQTDEHVIAHAVALA